MPPPPVPHQTAFALAPAPRIAALCAAALLAFLLPEGRPGDTLALLATAAALFAAHERRDRDMLLATGLAIGLAPAGLLFAPLCIGLAIRRKAARDLPIAAGATLLTGFVLPWPPIAPTLPNLALLTSALPSSLALIVAFGIGMAAWLGARALVLPAGGVFAEARLGALLLAAVLPLPIGALGFVLMLAALPLPAPPRLHAANDNVALRRTVRLAA